MFVKKSALALAGSSAIVSTSLSSPNPGQQVANTGQDRPLLVTNQYPWITFYKRQDRAWEDNLETALSEVKESGADSLEPSLESVEQLELLSRHFEKIGLAMQTVYMNSILHEKDSSQQSIESILELAKRSKSLMDTRIVVTNPNPIRWGGPENKTDEQLAIQGEALEILGETLSEEGISLGYHFHDPEFRAGAREVHHMLASTDPRYVKLCLDAHWAYRGAGNSNVALHDIIKLYGDRIVELHVRQSKDGIWTEAFGEGDINYHRLVAELKELGIKPVVCMEQAVEKQSANTLNALEAHKISHRKARRVFAPFLK